jgi:DNA-binding transcriptional MerR regulator
MAEKLYYKIGEACREVDIQPYVLRYWETEFSALAPDKSRSGQRVYNEDEISLIRRIKELLYDEGYTIAGAKKRLDSELDGDGDGDSPKKHELKVVGAAEDEAVAADQESKAVDTQTSERIETLEKGVGKALEEVRDLLQSLEG